MEFLDTEKEIDRYVCKVSDDSYEGEITLLNVTYEKEDSMEDNKETYGQMFDFLQKFSRENLIVSDLDENGEKITRERAAIGSKKSILLLLTRCFVLFDPYSFFLFS